LFFSSRELFIQDIPAEKKTAEGGVANAPIKDFTKMELHDYNLVGQSPSLSVIVEGVQWAILRFEPPCGSTAVLKPVFAMTTIMFYSQKSTICGAHAS
jgi:hypothetical protein